MNTTDATTETRFGLARDLAARVVAMSYDAMPAAALHWARVGILDTVGVTLAGSREPAARLSGMALDLTDGPALIFGTRHRVGLLDAAVVNGTASHALDFDDCNNTIGGHPSAPVLSAMFALADVLGSSGEDFITAYITGFEVECKLGMAVNMHHYMKGWHPTATLGTFGAAASAAKLMHLDAAKTAVALAIAASLAAGLKANFGTMTKPLHVGNSARAGLYAARLAAVGFTANQAAVFEHKMGFLDVFNGPGTYDVASAMAAWADPLDIVDPGVAIKQYPCCGSTHPAADAVLDIVRTHHPNIDDIERIDAATHSRRLAHTNRPDPDSSLDAKFSVQYVIARALVDGHVGVSDFDGDAFRDERVQKAMKKVRMTAYDESGMGDFEAANHFGGAVRVTMKDGTVFSSQVDMALGRTSANPLPEERLHDKFRLCAKGVVRDDAVKPILEAIARFEEIRNVRELTSQIQGATLEP